MTGAPVPAGADAVVMVERATRQDGRVRSTARPRRGNPSTRAGARPSPGRWRSPRGRAWTTAAWRAGGVRLRAGGRFRQTRGGHSGHRGRNRRGGRDAARVPDSQFERLVAGGAGGARRRRAAHVAHRAGQPGAHARADRSGIEADLLLISGGVSAGKYDVVEQRTGRPGRRVLLRPRADPAGPAAGVRARPRQVLLRSAGQPGLHHGHLRTLRARRAGTARRAAGNRPEDAVRAADARVPAPSRRDALSAGAVERGRQPRLRRSPGAAPATSRRWRAPTLFWWPTPTAPEYAARRLIRVLLK